jgi:hypothetical protein
MIDKDLKEYLDVLRRNSMFRLRANNTVQSTLGQLMLMLANTGSNVGESKLASAIRELHRSYSENLSENTAMVNSAVAVFNGKGELARELENRIAELTYIQSELIGAQWLEKNHEVLVLKNALEKFNFHPELMAPQRNPILPTLALISDRMENLLPTKWTPDPGEEPIEFLLSAHSIPQIMTNPDYQSGIYAAFSSGTDVPFGWVMVLRVESTKVPGLTALVLQHHTGEPFLFFHHPYEDYWLQWDQAICFPGIVEDIENEHFRVLDNAGLLKMSGFENVDAFTMARLNLHSKATELFKVAEQLPERASIMPWSGVRGAGRPLAEFSRYMNTARCSVICNKAVMVFYGTQLSSGNWVVTSNLIRPAQPGVEIIEPIDPTSLTTEHRAALVQAGHYALDHWTDIGREKNTKETKEA